MNTSKTQSPESLGSPSGSAFVEQARKNIAKWGKQDLETLGLAIAEETGEICQAILKARWEGGDRERIRAEAIDLGALCIQIIHYLDNPPCAACDRGDYQLGHSDFCPQNNQAHGARAEK
jgi:hypothetical protein